jgi:hypothetical protein
MVKRTTGRVSKQAAPAGQPIVKHRSKSAISKRAHRKSAGTVKKAAPKKVKTEDYELEGIAAVMKGEESDQMLHCCDKLHLIFGSGESADCHSLIVSRHRSSVTCMTATIRSV